ncbi:hypothetical protein R3P38DRAFT_2802010 [Favolaschia claudopus]|uniref:Uncharacterized protein n=1 Tax=Favolaschia claudopus TaxID=2862362 RepID=A0AAV9ZVK5_9AGAR
MAPALRLEPGRAKANSLTRVCWSSSSLLRWSKKPFQRVLRHRTKALRLEALHGVFKMNWKRQAPVQRVSGDAAELSCRASPFRNEEERRALERKQVQIVPVASLASI